MDGTRQETDKRRRAVKTHDRTTASRPIRDVTALREVGFYSLVVVIFIVLALILGAAVQEAWNWLRSVGKTLLS